MEMVPTVDHPYYFGIFFALIGALLFLDLGILNRKAKEMSLKSSLFWTAFWVSIALGFNYWIYEQFGKDQAVMFLTGYVVELSLSVDNLFVFLLIFNSFKVPSQYQHRVLFWGIMGALLMRAVCIFVGVEALERFGWLTYLFGAILIYSGIKTLVEGEDESDPSQGAFAKFLRKFFRVSDNYDGHHFVTTTAAGRAFTPLFIVLIMVEASDVIFAIDSIPAVLAITRDPFIVYTSNVFAILGLRSIYFALAHMARIFHYLNYALSFILIFVGTKIILHHTYEIPTALALGAIAGSLAVAVIASLIFAKPEPKS